MKIAKNFDIEISHQSGVVSTIEMNLHKLTECIKAQKAIKFEHSAIK